MRELGAVGALFSCHSDYNSQPQRKGISAKASKSPNSVVVWNDALAICKKSEKLPNNNDLQKLVITQAKKTSERFLAEYGF